MTKLLYVSNAFVELKLNDRSILVFSLSQFARRMTNENFVILLGSSDVDQKTKSELDGWCENYKTNYYNWPVRIGIQEEKSIENRYGVSIDQEDSQVSRCMVLLIRKIPGKWDFRSHSKPDSLELLSIAK
jgi:hypothetical protein